ncbi:hypothetical protein SADUNF_Sadunf02G0145800 [Salix dunnii]|uniref:Uncharacterized protein n=1 Tax=Salix dunnii TaxID=1413687 RepID=A0A835TI57_9ROSI|nr:hypothetical protein SADUNF_Sadunf02G0145800 [Salix dunnii]
MVDGGAVLSCLDCFECGVPPTVFPAKCKTGLLVMDRLGVGRSGQASTVIDGKYCMNRFATDIDFRGDVIKVAVEDLAMKLIWAGPLEELPEDDDASGAIIAR